MNFEIEKKLKKYEKHIEQLEYELEKTKTLNKEYYRKVNISPLDDNWVIESDKMLEIVRSAMQIAPFPTSVLLTGEPGVGKEVVSSFIHKNSKRSNKPFIKVNCGAIPKNLFESEMFGYEPQAFSGDKKDGKPGYFELADKGTLLLDEIGEIPLNLQEKLLQVLQSREVQRIAGSKSKNLDIRIISTTNKDLKQLVQEKKFREDLYNWLNVTNLNIPPLRERVKDIIPLANFFLEDFCRNYGFRKTFSKKIIECFKKYEWPGNIRELKNLVENLAMTSHDETIAITHLPYHMVKKFTLINDDFTMSNVTLSEALSRVEKQLIENALIDHGSLRKAAKVLGVSHSTLSRKLNKLNLNL